MSWFVSRTQVTPSMITQTCQEICDIKTGAHDSITAATKQANSTSKLGTLPSNSPDQERDDGRGDSYGTETSYSTVPVRPPKYNPGTLTRHGEDPPQADQCNPGMLVAPRSSHDPPASSERNNASAFADAGRGPSAWPVASCREKYSPSDSSSELSSPGTLIGNLHWKSVESANHSVDEEGDRRGSSSEDEEACHAPGIFRPSHTLTFHFYTPFTSRPFIFSKSHSNKGTKAKTTVVLIIQETRYYCYKQTTRLLVVITIPVPNTVLIVAHPTIVVLLDQPTDEDVGYPFRLTHLQLGPQSLLHDRQS